MLLTTSQLRYQSSRIQETIPKGLAQIAFQPVATRRVFATDRRDGRRWPRSRDCAHVVQLVLHQNDFACSLGLDAWGQFVEWRVRERAQQDHQLGDLRRDGRKPDALDKAEDASSESTSARSLKLCAKIARGVDMPSVVIVVSR